MGGAFTAGDIDIRSWLEIRPETEAVTVTAAMQTAEQWMRTVDTRTSDFLRIRFALEAAGESP